MLFARIVALALLLAPVATFAQSPDSAPPHVVPLHTFFAGQWIEKVSGDFSKPGEPFVIRVHQDAGYITLPHVHPIDEHITVVKGTWSLGMGRRFNQSAPELMETGTYGMAPTNMEHFAWSKTETILQVHGIGPFTSRVVEPVYELTDKGVFFLTSLLLPGRPTSSNPPDCFPRTSTTRCAAMPVKAALLARGAHRRMPASDRVVAARLTGRINSSHPRWERVFANKTLANAGRARRYRRQ